MSTPSNSPTKLKLNEGCDKIIVIDACAIKDMGEACQYAPSSGLNKKQLAADVFKDMDDTAIVLTRTVGREIFGADLFTFPEQGVALKNSVIQQFDPASGKITFKPLKEAESIIDSYMSHSRFSYAERNKISLGMKYTIALSEKAQLHCVTTDVCLLPIKAANQFHRHHADGGEHSMAELVKHRGRYGISQQTPIALVSDDRGAPKEIYSDRSFSYGEYQMETLGVYKRTLLPSARIGAINQQTMILSARDLVGCMEAGGRLPKDIASQLNHGFEGAPTPTGVRKQITSAVGPKEGILKGIIEDKQFKSVDLDPQYSAKTRFSQTLSPSGAGTAKTLASPAKPAGQIQATKTTHPAPAAPKKPAAPAMPGMPGMPATQQSVGSGQTTGGITATNLSRNVPLNAQLNPAVLKQLQHAQAQEPPKKPANFITPAQNVPSATHSFTPSSTPSQSGPLRPPLAKKPSENQVT